MIAFFRGFFKEFPTRAAGKSAENLLYICDGCASLTAVYDPAGEQAERDALSEM